MTKLAREAVRPSDRKIVDALEWVAKQDGRISFAGGMIAVTVGVYHAETDENRGLVALVDSIREEWDKGVANG